MLFEMLRYLHIVLLEYNATLSEVVLYRVPDNFERLFHTPFINIYGLVSHSPSDIKFDDRCRLHISSFWRSMILVDIRWLKYTSTKQNRLQLSMHVFMNLDLLMLVKSSDDELITVETRLNGLFLFEFSLNIGLRFLVVLVLFYILSIFYYLLIKNIKRFCICLLNSNTWFGFLKPL